MKNMSLLQEWRDYAYANDMKDRAGQLFWANYFNQEKEVYKVLLANPDKVYEGTVTDLAKEFNLELKYMAGFLDGINDSLVTQNPIEEMEQDTKVGLAYDKEKLYYNMVAAQADWLYDLEEWDALLTPERRKELYRQQKNSGTVVKEKKIGRNDPCPCGSGKKYKKCCGANI
jgi:preprotein translocase subunit SecA